MTANDLDLHDFDESFVTELMRVKHEAEKAEYEASQCGDWVSRMRARRLADRMRIEPGFPRFAPLNGIDELRIYISQPLITCLVCGKKYKLLANHLRGTHGIEIDDYRAAYNIPWRTSLTSSDLLEAKSKYIKNKLCDPVFSDSWFSNSHKHREMAHQDARFQRRSPFKKDLSIENLKKAGVQIGRWKEVDFLRVLDSMKEKDLLLNDVAGKFSGLPPLGAARKWFYSTAERRVLLSDTVRSLSIVNQARAGMFGQSIINEIKLLRQRGLLLREISAAVGLSVMTVAKLSRLT